MATEQKNLEEQGEQVEPRGFGEHSRGLSAEYAHELGWGLDEAERRHSADRPQDTDGGNDYEYGARDQGDEPVNTAIDHGEADRLGNTPASKESRA